MRKPKAGPVGARSGTTTVLRNPSPAPASFQVTGEREFAKDSRQRLGKSWGNWLIPASGVPTSTRVSALTLNAAKQKSTAKNRRSRGKKCVNSNFSSSGRWVQKKARTRLARCHRPRKISQSPEGCFGPPKPENVRLTGELSRWVAASWGLLGGKCTAAILTKIRTTSRQRFVICIS